MEKVCIKCFESKELIEFTKSKTSKFGYRNICKICTNNAKNHEKYKPKQKEYREKNRETKIKYMSEYNNIPEVKERVKKWFIINKERVNTLKRHRRKNNPHIEAWRRLLTHSLKRLGKEKETHTIDSLGYSALDLKKHISSLFTEGMSWDNYGEWHIDHIKPVSSFNKSTPTNIVNSLINLQPLWASTKTINGYIYIGNLNKNNKIKT